MARTPDNAPFRGFHTRDKRRGYPDSRSDKDCLGCQNPTIQKPNGCKETEISDFNRCCPTSIYDGVQGRRRYIAAFNSALRICDKIKGF